MGHRSGVFPLALTAGEGEDLRDTRRLTRSWEATRNSLTTFAKLTTLMLDKACTRT